MGLAQLVKGGEWYQDLMSWQMTGMIIGGVVFGVFGDRMGRLTTLFGSILIYSLANIANAFVSGFWGYALWRFVAGFGLSGELGGCIALVSETLSKERRGYGTSLVTFVGMFGAVAGGIMAELVSWRANYIIGGLMGLVLLLLRIGVRESGMYENAKVADNRPDSISRGNIFALFTNTSRFIKYLKCMFIALPTWYMIGILVQRTASHFGPEANIQGPLLSSRSVSISYLGASIGDLASGFISQLLKSRKKTVLLFLAHSGFFVFVFLFLARGWSNNAYYTLIFLMSIGRGYWAIFVTIAAEQFGTNLRATVATTVPNFARGTLIPVTFMFTEMTPKHLSATTTAAILGVLCFAISVLSIVTIEETFGKNLDYLEMRVHGSASMPLKEGVTTEMFELQNNEGDTKKL